MRARGVGRVRKRSHPCTGAEPQRTVPDERTPSSPQSLAAVREFTLGPVPRIDGSMPHSQTVASGADRGMSADDVSQTPPLEIQVFCLACGACYRKPLAGSVVSSNPGCSSCGYLGWVLDADAPSPFARDEPRSTA
jgi:hypothetical protein